jgi:hypothetical protein
LHISLALCYLVCLSISSDIQLSFFTYICSCPLNSNSNAHMLKPCFVVLISVNWCTNGNNQLGLWIATHHQWWSTNQLIKTMNWFCKNQVPFKHCSQLESNWNSIKFNNWVKIHLNLHSIEKKWYAYWGRYWKSTHEYGDEKRKTSKKT